MEEKNVLIGDLVEETKHYTEGTRIALYKEPMLLIIKGASTREWRSISYNGGG